MTELITGEKLCRMLCNADFDNRKKVIDNVIELGADIEEPLAYLALLYAYNHKQDERAKAIPYFEKWEVNPVFYDDLTLPEFIYLDMSETYEKEYMFDKTIECLKQYFSYTYKEHKIKKKLKLTQKGLVTYLYYRAKDGEADFYYQFIRLGEFYIKMGTKYALSYWQSLKSSPYYLKGSEFKNVVDEKLMYAEAQDVAGYVYKPLTKVNQAKFLSYAKEKGWR